MNGDLRLASMDDIPALRELIALSVRVLQATYYSPAQREAALGTIFGVDRQLIADGTYFCACHDGTVVGCGGWSRRESPFGGDADRPNEDRLLDPVTEPARIRAFFVHPHWTRRGIARTILTASESAIIAAGFPKAELVATLAGEPLYHAGGFCVVERYELPLAGGLTLPVVRMRKHLSR